MKRWIVEFGVSCSWARDGFNLNDEEAMRMLEARLPFAERAELSAKVVEIGVRSRTVTPFPHDEPRVHGDYCEYRGSVASIDAAWSSYQRERATHFEAEAMRLALLMVLEPLPTGPLTPA
jgi:hypothetical protein